MIDSSGMLIDVYFSGVSEGRDSKKSDLGNILFAQLVKVYLMEDWQWSLGLE